MRLRHIVVARPDARLGREQVRLTEEQPERHETLGDPLRRGLVRGPSTEPLERALGKPQHPAGVFRDPRAGLPQGVEKSEPIRRVRKQQRVELGCRRTGSDGFEKALPAKGAAFGSLEGQLHGLLR